MRIDADWLDPSRLSARPLFYPDTGNEGPVDEFANATGFMFDIAPKFNALLVFAEHRYYGESLPFGQNSFTPQALQFLTTEQALADYVELIPQIKAQFGCPDDTTVIAFGGR